MRSELPRLGIHLVRPRFLVIPGLAALTCLSSPSLIAQSSPADGPWTGSIKCQLDVDTGTYKRRETQTWTITGPPLSTTGSVRVYPATWSATGEGSLHSSQGSQLINIQWKVDVPPTSAQLAMFVRTTDNKLIISQQSSRTRVPRGITGTRTVKTNGKQQPSSPINAVAEEWTFGYLGNDPPFTSLTGSTKIDAEPLPAQLNPIGTPKTAACTWQFSLDATPAAGDQRLAPPQLLAISPTAVDQGATAVPITLTARNTHWQAGNTTVDFGAGISVASLTVNSPVSATALLNVAQAAGPGIRPVMITTTGGTRPETVGLPDKFSVNPVLTAIVSPALVPTIPLLTGVAPVSAAPGANAFQVSLTGSGTHFAAGTSKADFGPGVTVASLTVTSPTTATAVLNIARTAAVGLRTVSVTTGTEVAKRAEAFSLLLPPAPPSSGRYRIVFNGFRVNRPTFDDILHADGMGDEVYAAAHVHVCSRDSISADGSQLSLLNPFFAKSSTLIKSAVHGNNGNWADRVRAGGASPSGGLVSGDVFPADPAHTMANPVPNSFPLLLWEGTLTNGGDVVVIVPSLWEWDGNSCVYDKWAAGRAVAFNQRELDGLLERIRNFDLTPTPSGPWTINCQNYLFPDLGHCECDPGGKDRPIGVRQRDEQSGLQFARYESTGIVVTREAIEKMLSLPPIAGSAPGVLPIGIIETGQRFDGVYDMFIRFERVKEVTADATPVYVATTSPNAPVPKAPVKEERDRSFLGDLGPKIIEVSPNSGEQWSDSQVITFTTQATNFVRGTTKIDLGPGITLLDPPLFITMANRGIGTFKIAGDATPGPRTVTITTGTEVATLPGGFTVTPRDVREVFSVSPNTGMRGHQALSVSIKRPWRYFYLGTTLDFGDGITVTPEVLNDFEMKAVLNIAGDATVGPRPVTVKIPTRNPETFPGVFTVEARPDKPAFPSSVRDTFIPALIAVTPNSAMLDEADVKVDVTGRYTSFGSAPMNADFGSGINVTSLKINSPTSITATLDITGSAGVGPRPVKINMATPTQTAFGVLLLYKPEGVLTLANGFTVMPFSTSGPHADRYEPNDRNADAKLILSGMASCYLSVRGAPSSLIGGAAFPPPPAVTISANFHLASDTSDWYRVSTHDGPPLQLTGQPKKYMDLKIAASISDGPPDGVYQIAISEGATVLRTSTSAHAPTVSYQWSPKLSNGGLFGLVAQSGKDLTIEVRHISGAPSNRYYKLHIKLGD